MFCLINIFFQVAFSAPIKLKNSTIVLDHEEILKSPENQKEYQLKRNSILKFTNIHNETSVEFIGNRVIIKANMNSHITKTLIIEPDILCNIYFYFNENSTITLGNAFISSLLNEINIEMHIFNNTKFHILQSTWNVTSFIFNFFQKGNCHYIVDTDYFPFFLKIERPVNTIFTVSRKNLGFEQLTSTGNVTFLCVEQSTLRFKYLFFAASNDSQFIAKGIPITIDALSFTSCSAFVDTGPITCNRIDYIYSNVTIGDLIGSSENCIINFYQGDNYSLIANSIKNLHFYVKIEVKSELDYYYPILLTKIPIDFQIVNKPYNSIYRKVVGYKPIHGNLGDYHSYGFCLYSISDNFVRSFNIGEGRDFYLNIFQLNKTIDRLVFSETQLEFRFSTRYNETIYLIILSKYCQNLVISGGGFANIAIIDENPIDIIHLYNMGLHGCNFTAKELYTTNVKFYPDNYIVSDLIQNIAPQLYNPNLICNDFVTDFGDLINITETDLVFNTSVVNYVNMKSVQLYINNNSIIAINNATDIEKIVFTNTGQIIYSMDVISRTDNYTDFSDHQLIESNFYSGNIPKSMKL